MKIKNQVIILLFATFWNWLAIAKQTSAVVSFYSNITLSNVAQASLDSDSQTVVSLTAATVMGLPSSSVNYIATVFQNTIVTRRLLNEKATEDVSYEVIAVLYTQVALSETTYQSADELYETATSQLVTEVNNNQFTTSLRANAVQYGTPDLTNTDATYTTSSTATVQYSSSSDNSLSAGAVAGIIICVLFVVAIVVYCAYKRYNASSFSQPGKHTTKGYVLNEDEEDVEIENPVHHRGNHREEIRESKNIMLNDLNI